MQSQVPYKETFRQQSRQNDEYIRYILRTVVSHGIEEEVFSDAERVARSLMTIIHGARIRAVVLDDPSTLDTARRTDDQHIAAVLLERE